MDGRPRQTIFRPTNPPSATRRAVTPHSRRRPLLGALAAAGLIVGLAACQARALPPPPSQLVVTLPPAAPPNWTLPSAAPSDAASYPIATAMGTSSSFDPVPVVAGGRPPVTKAPPPPVPAIYPSGPAPSGSGGYIAGTVWNDANRNRVFDAGEAGLAKVRVEIDGCSSATTVVYTSASGGFAASGLNAGLCRLRFILSGYVFEGTVPSLGYPAPSPVLVVSAAGRASYLSVAMVP